MAPPSEQAARGTGPDVIVARFRTDRMSSVGAQRQIFLTLSANRTDQVCARDQTVTQWRKAALRRGLVN